MLEVFYKSWDRLADAIGSKFELFWELLLKHQKYSYMILAIILIAMIIF